jgi:hypothetical protein
VTPILLPRIVCQTKVKNKQAKKREQILRFSWWLQTVGAGAKNRFAGLITEKLWILFQTKCPKRVSKASPTPSNTIPKRDDADGSNLVIELSTCS